MTEVVEVTEHLCLGCGVDISYRHGTAKRCEPCAETHSRSYKREWGQRNYEQNRERYREYHLAYYYANRERYRETGRAWYEANREQRREQIREYGRARYEAHREVTSRRHCVGCGGDIYSLHGSAMRCATCAETHRIEEGRERAHAWQEANREQRREYLDQNRERIAEQRANYRQVNHDKCVASDHRRRALLLAHT